MKEEWVTIQFGSFKPVMLSLMVPMTLMEVEHVQDIPDEDNEGWTLVTRRRPRKQIQVQPPPFRRRKCHARNKKPRYPRGKKKPNSGKRHGVQPVELLEQEPLVPVTLEEFFPRGFFKNDTVNMVSCSELDDKDDEEDAQGDL